MEQGDIMGHEFMGDVVEVGPGISKNKLKVGDRVVVPFTIACGNCQPCKDQQWSCCDNSNPNAWIAEKMLGYSPSGLLGSFAVLKKHEKIALTTKEPGDITLNNDTITVVNSSGAPAPVPVKDLDFVVDKPTYDKEMTGKPGICTDRRAPSPAAPISSSRPRPARVTWSASTSSALSPPCLTFRRAPAPSSI